MAEQKQENKKKQQEEKKKTENSERNEASGQPHPPVLDVVPEDSGDTTGSVRISEDVIAAVVRKYALEVEGVVRFGSNTIVSGLAEMIGRKSGEGNVVVNLEEDSVSVSVTLILEFGVKIPEVASLVQDVIRSRVGEITGKEVSRVDVTVQGMEELDEAEQASSENEVTQ